MNRAKGIDIVIPVYNALEDLKICLESIKKHTDLSLDRVVMIDDKSPDPNVWPYMESVGREGIVVLQNGENLGFSGTVNRGMTFSDRDVILLNSDTVVTAGWVDKICACAASDPAIGTVTPFSNNATLCSIPEFCRENRVPYGLSIDEYARIIEKSSMKKYPRITVAVGFCMYIKREVINTVGLFDRETFRKGYGEENDFCWRAEQLGYCHVLCDDTYIYHSGTVSFLSEEKKKLIADHEKILRDRYPLQDRRNAEFVRDDPIKYLRTNADIYAGLANGKKNVLYLLHLDFRVGAANNIGGTQFHVKDLTEGLKDRCNIFVLAREEEALRLTVYFGERQMSFAFRIGPKPVFMPFHSPEIQKVLRTVLRAFSIDIVHVHHLMGLSFDIFSEAKELGIPVVTTLHDFYYICPAVNLLKDGETYCGGNCSDGRACLCKQQGYATQVDYVPLWQKTCRAALSGCRELVAPSENAKSVYLSLYPELEGKIRVIPHGMDVFAPDITGFGKPTEGFEYGIESAFSGDLKISGWALQKDVDSRESTVFVCLGDGAGNFRSYRAMPLCRGDVAKEKGGEKYLYCGFSVQIPDSALASGDGSIQIVIRNGGEEYRSQVSKVSGYRKREKSRRRIAFLGGLNRAKGSGIAYELITESGSKYDWYIIGGVGDAKLAALEKKNLFKTDWYKRENVISILRENEIDLVCIMSVWPETFCYTVSEAQLAGVPLLVTDLGAQGDRVRADKTGWTVSKDASAAEILSVLDGIFADEEGYARVKEATESFGHKSIGGMCLDYAALYDSIGAEPKKDFDFDSSAVYTAFVRGNADQAASDGMGDADLIRRVNELEATMNALNQSLEYRMFRFFNREKIPGKKLIKKCIGLAYRVYVKLFR